MSTQTSVGPTHSTQMPGNRILIWGAGGHAQVVADIIHRLGGPEIVGFLDDINAERHGTSFCGNRILGGAEQLGPLFEDGVRQIVIAVGDCVARLRSASRATEGGFQLATLCHPKAVIARTASIVYISGKLISPAMRSPVCWI